MALFTDPGPLIADCVYGGHRVVAMIGRGNIRGPEFNRRRAGGGVENLEPIPVNQGVRKG